MLQKFGTQTLRRQPEMDMVMKDEAQDLEYSLDGEVGSLAILYDLVIEEVLRRSPIQGRALDISSGAGQLLSKLAREMPQMNFLGTDLSEHMIAIAAKNANTYGVKNVQFIKQDMYRLLDLIQTEGEHCFDLITWSLALHHCETSDQVILVFNSIARLLKPNGTLIIFDINRPKTGALAVKFADEFNANQGSWYYQDSLDSYKAAFTFQELEAILQRSDLKNAVHFKPVVGDFFQFIRVSKTLNKKVKNRSNLKYFWQKRDLAFLKLSLLGKL